MQLPLTTIIAGKKTVSDWLTIRTSLTEFNNSGLWQSTFNIFFEKRLNERYLIPIQSIKTNDSYNGEGFSIMTIICSLIEFLETTYQGINYRYNPIGGDQQLAQYEYSSSGKIFTDFLTSREPFASQFNKELAKKFYSDVRCGLLHEARTNGKWIIKANTSNKTLLVESKDTEIIIYRDHFYDALINFVNIYKTELLESKERKEAFIRKFNKLCEE